MSLLMSNQPNTTPAYPFERLDSDKFRQAFRRFPAGVAVVTADIGAGPVGMTVSSLASVGLEPPAVVFSISPLSSSTPTIRQADTIVIHLLTEAHLNLGRVCATSDIDRFNAGEEWTTLPTGEPRFIDVAAWMRARIARQVNVSGSVLIVAEVLEGEIVDIDGADSPLVYVDRQWHGLNGASRL